jgi:hypothetical protein
MADVKSGYLKQVHPYCRADTIKRQYKMPNAVPRLFRLLREYFSDLLIQSVNYSEGGIISEPHKFRKL